MISIKNLKKTFKQWKHKDVIFEDLNLEIESWEFISVIWKSWSWKTTFLNMLAWLIGFDSWEIKFWKKRYSEKTSDQLTAFRGKNISFVFQDFHLIPNLTVRENIELPLDINKIEPRFTTKQILEKVWLLEKVDSYPYELSWWEQQRVAIARAFIWETKLLLADEPTWNLDKKNSEKVMQTLRDLHKEAKNTVVLISHDLDLTKWSDHVYEIKGKDFHRVKV